MVVVSVAYASLLMHPKSAKTNKIFILNMILDALDRNRL